MPKDTNRPRRVAELIRRELAALIPRELDSPLAHKITLTGAVVAPDFATARVYFSLLAGSREAKEAAQTLNHAAGFLRRALHGRVNLRRGVPQLQFVFDESLERGARVDALIARALEEDKQHPQD
jgi:ribosome-binding factor A